MFSIVTGGVMIHYAAYCWEREFWERGRPRLQSLRNNLLNV